MKQIRECVGKLNVTDANGSSTSTARQIADRLLARSTFISNFTDRRLTGKLLKAAVPGHYVSSSG